ncbi:MAG: helix-turn-helix transcriptional regulator, partial [Simkania sp.]|nr:helix-turn-helix transcriptional regulator [Simkania sp.]
MHPVQKSILKLLEDSKGEFTINQVAQKLEIERHTAGKYLEGLEAMGMCRVRTKGKAKLWSLTASPLFSLMSKDNPVSKELKDLLAKVEENVTFQDDQQSILWSNKPDQEGKKCYEVFAGKSHICKDCELVHAAKEGKEIKGSCKEHHLIGTPIKDKEDKVVAIM